MDNCKCKQVYRLYIYSLHTSTHTPDSCFGWQQGTLEFSAVVHHLPQGFICYVTFPLKECSFALLFTVFPLICHWSVYNWHWSHCSVYNSLYLFLFSFSVQHSNEKLMEQRHQSHLQLRQNSSLSPVCFREMCRSFWSPAPTRSSLVPSSTRYISLISLLVLMCERK